MSGKRRGKEVNLTKNMKEVEGISKKRLRWKIGKRGRIEGNKE